MTKPVTLNDGIARLRLQFLAALDGLLDTVESVAADDTVPAQGILEDTLLVLQTTAEHGGSLGYPDLGAAADRTEDLLRADLAAFGEIQTATKNDLTGFLDLAQEALAGTGRAARIPGQQRVNA